MAAKNYVAIELITNILAKLPAKSILRFKLVCKGWHGIITGECFAQVYDQESHVVFCCKLRGSSKAMHMIESYQGVKEQSFEFLNTRNSYADLQSQIVGLGRNLEVGNSCRGFLLIIGQGMTRSTKTCFWKISMYNPLTNEHALITSPRCRRGEVKLVVSGLGYSLSTKHYKLVTIFRRQGSSAYSVEVRTIGTDDKRRIHGPKFILNKIRPQNNPSLALNGSLHWLATGEQIARFDIDKEEFSLMDSPCIGDSGKYVISIGMLHGFLCVNIIEPGNTRHGVESWVMKEYGNAESWTQFCVVKKLEFCVVKKLEFQLREPTQELSSKYRIWESDDKGKVLVLTPSGSIVSYDLNLQECLPVRGMSLANSIQDTFLHFPGFFSLSSIGTTRRWTS